MRRVLMVAVMAVVVGLSGLAGTASAADESASCKGILLSALAGDPGGAAEVTHIVHAIVKALGLPPGPYVSAAAGHLHEEDVAACLKALGF
jgi:hypothetical protein